MILALALFTQVATLATARTPTAAPIRVWRTDSNVSVSLRDPGYVTLLHVSAEGRISVLFPFEPDLDTWVPAEMPLQMSLPPRAQGSAATFVAIRSSSPFDFAALREGVGAGPTWGYGRAWLFHPTAAIPHADLLAIA